MVCSRSLLLPSVRISRMGISLDKGEDRGASWFDRNPKKTIAFTVLFFLALIDRTAGVILIPADQGAFRRPHPVYHHDLLPNTASTARWGNAQYPMFTNSLGFRDRSTRTISRESSKRRILLIGDSFTEGLGLPYEDTFAGILDARLEKFDIEVLNAAVVSYSPKLYYLKVRYLLEEHKLDFDDLFVFIDISDVQNELSYEQFEPLQFPLLAKLRFDLKKFLRKTSFFFYVLTNASRGKEDSPFPGELRADGLFPCLAGIDDELIHDEDFLRSLSLWTVDRTIYERFGKRGLLLAKDNMQRLVDLCKKHNISLTIAVYPWPEQIYRRDLESIQVRFWRKFCLDNDIDFINLFPEFIKKEMDYRDVVYRYFILGDEHWNAAGHRLVADRVFEHLDLE